MYQNRWVERKLCFPPSPPVGRGLPVIREFACWGVNRWEGLRRGIATPVWGSANHPDHLPAYLVLHGTKMCLSWLNAAHVNLKVSHFFCARLSASASASAETPRAKGLAVPEGAVTAAWCVVLKQSDENTDANALLPLCLRQMLKLENSELRWEADFCLRLLLNKFSCSTFTVPSSLSPHLCGDHCGLFGLFTLYQNCSDCQ